MRTRRMLTLALALILAPALGACGGGDDVDDDTTFPPAADAPATQAQALSVRDVELGRSIDADGRIADNASTDDFAVTDTIYVSVSTDGSASGVRLTARWTFEDGQLVDESSQTISPTGGAVTQFHISNPNGWPVGSYTVEIQLDGRTVATEEFDIG